MSNNEQPAIRVVHEGKVCWADEVQFESEPATLQIKTADGVTIAWTYTAENVLRLRGLRDEQGLPVYEVMHLRTLRKSRDGGEPQEPVFSQEKTAAEPEAADAAL